MNLLDAIPLAEVFGATHLLGLSLAVGGVALADGIAFKSLLNSSEKLLITLNLLVTLHHTIAFGLLLLLLSGTGILIERFDTLAEIPSKVWVKSGLVAILFINAGVINNRILPFIRSAAQEAPPWKSVISELSSAQRLELAFFSSVSSLGWAGAFFLGTLSLFKTMHAGQIIALLMISWLGLFLATLLMVDSSSWLKRPIKLPKDAPHLSQ